MLDFEIDYELNKFKIDNELNKFETYEILPDFYRAKIVERLRLSAVQIKLRVLNLIKKMDIEIQKLEAAHGRSSSALHRSKIWAQIHSLKLLRTVTLAGLDKFDTYIISENSKVLENLIRALERMFEAKFFKFTILAKESLKLIRSIEAL